MVSTAIPISADQGKFTPDKTHGQFIFSAESRTLISRTFDVNERPLVVRAYNLSGQETVKVLQVSGDGSLETPMVIEGKILQLSPLNTMLVLGTSGRYRFQLSDGLGTVTVIGHECHMLHWKHVVY